MSLAFFRRDLLAAGAAVVLAVSVLAATVGPWLVPFDPLGVDLAANYQPSSWTHPLGTDHLGRDTLSRLVAGARVSLGIALAATGAGLLLGAVLGLLAAWRRGVTELVAMQFVDILLALPNCSWPSPRSRCYRGTVSTVAVATHMRRRSPASSARRRSRSSGRLRGRSRRRRLRRPAAGGMCCLAPVADAGTPR
jgi:hypothetical protein